MVSAELQARLEAHHRAAYRWALGCCQRDPFEAEAVLQTVYLKVLEGKARFDGKAEFKTWLFSVIRFTAAQRRRNRLLRELLTMKYERSVQKRSEHPDDTVYRSEIRALFEEALLTLPVRQREVLQLVCYHDLSLSEAARVMRVSVGSARTHYERGKKRIRSLLNESRVFNESALGREGNREALSGTAAGG